MLLCLAIAVPALAQTADSALARFYQARWWRPAWVEANSVSPDAEELLRTLSLAHREGLDPGDYFPAALDSLLCKHLSPDEAWRLDTLLTVAFLRYAGDLSIGRVEPALVDSQWQAAPRGWNAAAVLEQALDEHQVGAALGGLAPSQSGYVALREALRRYHDLAARGGWPKSVRRRLASEGYDTAAGVTEAVRRFQVLHGLTPDGIVGPETREQLDITPAERARQIELNLERWRWEPPALGDRYIVVNSAAFVLELVERDTVRFAARAVVGRTDWPTPITSSRATDIVFRPVWKVPRAIAVQELLPLIQRDPEYFTRAGFRLFSDSLDGAEVNPRDVTWTTLTDSTFAYHLEQEPGPENPLGGMKLVFWTPFGVFIHDTPSRSSFSERWRNFSHGCIRVEHADQLGALLLPDWPADSIQAAMTTGRQRWVRLPTSIPVHIVYWTAWVAEDGMVAFVSDPYGWDEKLAQALDARGAERLTMGQFSVP
jgi:murein L,D-transpeptidase YcbB/YkuD